MKETINLPKYKLVHHRNATVTGRTHSGVIKWCMGVYEYTRERKVKKEHISELACGRAPLYMSVTQSGIM